MAQQDELLRQAFSYQDSLVAYAYALTRDWSLAHDAFQEAIIAMNHKADELESARLFGWLKHITRNKAIDIIRKYESIDRTQEKLALLVDSCFDRYLNEELCARKSRESRALYKCMKTLRREARELLVYFYRDRRSCVELAKIFKRSENALHLLLSRSRATLKSCIKKEMVDESL